MRSELLSGRVWPRTFKNGPIHVVDLLNRGVKCYSDHNFCRCHALVTLSLPEGDAEQSVNMIDCHAGLHSSGAVKTMLEQQSVYVTFFSKNGKVGKVGVLLE